MLWRAPSAETDGALTGLSWTPVTLLETSLDHFLLIDMNNHTRDKKIRRRRTSGTSGRKCASRGAPPLPSRSGMSLGFGTRATDVPPQAVARH